MKELVDLHLPYKWIVTATVLQKKDKNMALASSVSWENNSDGAETCIFPNLKKKDTYSMTVMSIQ